FAFSPDGKLLAVGVAWRPREAVVALWELATGQQIAEWTGHQRPVTRLLFAPDGQALIPGSEDGTVLVVDVAPGRRTGREVGPQGGGERGGGGNPPRGRHPQAGGRGRGPRGGRPRRDDGLAEGEAQARRRGPRREDR